MASVERANFPEDSSSFAREFEEYRRSCRTRFEQQQCSQEDEGVAVEPTDEAVDRSVCDAQTASPVINRPPVAEYTNNVIFPTEKSNVGVIKASANSERRNSFSKVMSYCSGIFKKCGPSTKTPLTPQEKEKAKAEQKILEHKREQDARMAHLIAQLEFEGKSDAEIQLHLFHLRDMAQYARPKNNSLGELFRDMSQAFKDEFTLRRERQCVTVHVSSVNPFAAAMPANYVHDSEYSYEDLLTLEPVPRGLNSVDHLPVISYEGQELPSNQTTCAVCMGEFEVSEELRFLTCTHHFHRECIDKWLSVAPSCPVCKKEVNRE